MKIEELSIGDWVCAKLAKWESDDADMTPPLQVKRIDGIERHNLYVDLFNPANNTIEHSAFVEDLIPIPLTPEILEKNGFAKLGLSERRWENEEMCIAAVRDTDGKYWVVCEADYNRITPFDMYVYSVHDMQHALRLAGIEKEIEV